MIAFALALAILIVAAAKPQRTVAVPVEQAAVMLATDTSGSMQATDVKPTRLVAARRAAREFGGGAPRGVNIGVMAFSGRPRVLQSPTSEHEDVEIPASRLKREMSRILKEQGYITDFNVEPGRVGDVIKVKLRYTEKRDPVITGMERVSRPGRRRYVAKEDVPRVFGGMGTTIMSTSRGVMTGHEARQRGVGGEVVAHVW